MSAAVWPGLADDAEAGVADDDEAAGRVGSVGSTVAADGAPRGSDEMKTLSSARDCLNGLRMTCQLYTTPYSRCCPHSLVMRSRGGECA